MAAVPDEFPESKTAEIALGKTLVLITPHDTNTLTRMFKYIVCGSTGGAVAIVDDAGTAATLFVNAGGVLQFVPTILKNTGTAATPLYGVVR